jgi:hypothetical protein
MKPFLCQPALPKCSVAKNVANNSIHALCFIDKAATLHEQGPMLFSPKNFAKILAFFAPTTASFYKNLIITLVFDKNANFFAENCEKSQKIVIITSTPGANPTYDRELQRHD